MRAMRATSAARGISFLCVLSFGLAFLSPRFGPGRNCSKGVPRSAFPAAEAGVAGVEGMESVGPAMAAAAFLFSSLSVVLSQSWGRTSSMPVSKSSQLTGMAQQAASLPSPCARSDRANVTRMAMVFEKFSEKTIRAVMLAQEEAKKIQQDHVGTEMLVVGLLAEGSGGAKALQQLGVHYSEAKRELELMVGRGSGGKAEEIPFTTSAKQVLEDSVICAQEREMAQVSTCHLLRALLRQENSNGCKLLGKVLATDSLQVLRERIMTALIQVECNETGDKAPPGATRASSVEDEVDLTQTLKFGTDLTQAAREGRLDPLVGRNDELQRTIRILGRRTKNNPVLIGEAGVGKTSIALGLAQLIAEGKVPLNLQDKKVVQLDLALLLAGTRYRGDFEERLRAVVKEVSESRRRVILVVDEVHTLVGAGSGGDSGGGMDAANLLKPALARGELQCIGATTLDEYRKYIEKDPALERRFQPVTVPEPSEEESVQILKGLAPKYERHHQLQYAPEALEACVKLANQFIADCCLPDKAIDVMDEAGSKVRQQLFEAAEESHNAAERWAAGRELKEVIEQKKLAVNSERYDEAAQLKRREDELENRLARLQSSPENQDPQGLLKELTSLGQQIREAVTAERFTEAQELKLREKEVAKLLEKTGVTSEARRKVTSEDVAQVVSGWTGIAVEQVSASESARLLHLEKELHESIIGQDEAVGSVSRALRRARAGLRNPARPMAGFMFCGPTGVGKTALCKTLSKTFFGTEDTMIRLDMSEFMEKHTVSKLIGAPPGYVGYNDGGSLTEAVRRRPYSLVLFDEVEKAHPDVFNVLLQLLDDGRLTDSKGRVVSFANTMVIMTSNIGSRSVSKSAAGTSGLGFHSEEDGFDTYAKVKEAVDEEMKSFFRPEFLNRLDEVIVFRPLKEEDIRAIAEVEFKKVLDRLSDKDLHITLAQSFKDQVLKEGFDPAYGARPLRRAITRMLEDTLAEQLLEQKAEEDEIQQRSRHVTLSVSQDGKVQAEFKEDSPATGDRAVAKSPVLEGAARH
ncbi:ATP-dependent Clp protease ATP-binding subunit ClpA homolog [Durusdinium trenchii]|uniref:ATP-dependent Clp protease ATP-binding subunit ClpA homolog n=1 Tax=Durusdinium trenchii TaxID=1381693 RepID=A0ABP0SF32_9DINO